MKKRPWIRIGLLTACLVLCACAQPPDMPGGEAYASAGGRAARAEPLSAGEAAEAAEENAPDQPEKAWWMVPVFAHAMGTVDGRTETNSLDAFLQSYEAGQRVFEVDLQLTSDGHLVARHAWEQISYYNTEQQFAGVMDWETFRQTPVCFYYTPVDIEGIVSLMRAYPDVWFVTDSKDTGEDAVRAQTREIARSIREAGDPALWERIIVQLYHEDMYGWVSQEAPVSNWIFTLYQLTNPDYEKIGAFCREKNIPVVTLSTERLKAEHVEILHRYDRRVYVHTVNRLRAMQEMSWGADGFYSDYVTPGQLEAVLDGTNAMSGFPDRLEAAGPEAAASKIIEATS